MLSSRGPSDPPSPCSLVHLAWTQQTFNEQSKSWIVLSSFFTDIFHAFPYDVFPALAWSLVASVFRVLRPLTSLCAVLLCVSCLLSNDSWQMFFFVFLTPVLSAAGACHLSVSSLVCFYLSPAVYIFLSPVVWFCVSSVLSAAATCHRKLNSSTKSRQMS
jgi:hypothetical protein